MHENIYTKRPQSILNVLYQFIPNVLKKELMDHRDACFPFCSGTTYWHFIRQISNWSKLKQSADNNSKFDEKYQKVLSASKKHRG